MNMQVSKTRRVLQVQKGEKKLRDNIELKISRWCRCVCCVEQTKLVKQIHRQDRNFLYSFPNIFSVH